MAEYINIKGQSIEVVASDPANPTVGQIWYNSTSNTLKGNSYVYAAWSSAPNLNSGKQTGGGFGSASAALIFTGVPVNWPPTLQTNETEEWNGSTWTTAPNYPTQAYNTGGTGIETAGLAAGGGVPAHPDTNISNYWNGSAWTGAPNLAQSRANMSMFGTQTAAIGCGGYDFPNPRATTALVTQVFNGSSWTTGNNFASGAHSSGAFGTQTAGLVAGASSLPIPIESSSIISQEYDGTSWTIGNNLTVGKYGFAGSGTQTAAFYYSLYDYPAPMGPSDNWKIGLFYDGTSWSSVESYPGLYLANYGSPAGTQSAAISSGGKIPGTPSSMNTSFTYQGAGPQIQTITAS
jgi:hypothetical protein